MSDITNPNNDTQAVSNPATQTLFRFVSLRNPQLAKTEGNTKFIFRQENYTGVFDELLKQWAGSGKSKIDFLTEKVKSSGFNFGYIKRTESEIESWFGNFYTSSKNLIANGSLPSSEVTELLGIISTYNNDENKRKEVFGGLWDSIIYQVLTQENFYVKELLTQILQTIHYAKNYTIVSSETNVEKKKEKQKVLATAKTVIPDYLFVDSAAVPTVVQNKDFTVGFSKVGSPDTIKASNASGVQERNVENSVMTEATYLPTESMLKRQKVALAKYEREQLEDLKKELVKTQILYNKQYSKAYDLASKDYQALIKPLYDTYEQQLLQVEATFTEEMTPASKKLKLSQIVKPEIPDFEFEFRAERDVTFLQNKLSESSLKSFVDLIGEYAADDNISGRLSNGDILLENIVEIGKDQFILPADENLSFEEILETLNEKLSELNEKIYQNTEVEKQEYASVGGVLIPVNNGSISDKTEGKYFNAATIVKGNAWSVLLTFDDRSVSLNDGNYSAVTSNASITDGSAIQSASGVYQLFNGPNVLPINSFKNGCVVNAEFTLSDGEKYITSFTLIHMSSGNDTSINGYLTGSGSLNLKSTTTGGGDTGGTGTGGDTPDTPDVPVSTNNTFIPKGFGIKRLGITDYLKVEQTTHAYVEGEVANIENIMAREYRSQSTRRLRRSETTNTSSSDTERERSIDTTTSSRFEMQSEISKILQESTDMGINANTSYSNNTSFGNFSAQLGASYASHRSKEDSMRQAVTQAQEITARALDRVVTKVHQERVEKMIEEFEENNTHGFDNRKGDEHVVGVYRWVDKLMKNRVWNYGKRMMFEFAIPQPSKLHTLAAASVKKIIEKPVDPRTTKEFNLSNYSKLDDNNLKFWTGIYNVDLELMNPLIHLSLPISFSTTEDGKDSSELEEVAQGKFELEIPEGYSTTKNAKIEAAIITKDNVDPGIATYITVGNVRHEMVFVTATDFRSKFSAKIENLGAYQDKIGVSFSSLGFHTGNINIDVECELNNQGKLKIFNAIIEAYEDALADYNNKIAEEDAKASNIKDGNPMFYRQIEQEVLKHNSIAYLVDDSVSKNNKVLGKSLYSGTTVAGFEVARTGLDDYASLAKFMEQAFEWDIMSYNYYPYYWGKREDWDDMYQSENIDPLFRSFLRSGLARVVVTVRPGFEDAVQFYMSTGRLWSGGEVPVIGDPMYLSIVDEMKDIKGEEQGKPWITRLPTSLTILQAESIGLKVLSALPFTKEDPALFENPEEVITVSNFVKNAAMIESGTDRQVANIGLDEDSLLLTTDDDQVVSELPLDELKKALE